jgi:hypothetical protein
VLTFDRVAAFPPVHRITSSPSRIAEMLVFAGESNDLRDLRLDNLVSHRSICARRAARDVQ